MLKLRLLLGNQELEFALVLSWGKVASVIEVG